MTHSASLRSIAALLGAESGAPSPWLGMGCQAFGGTLTRRASFRALERAASEGIIYYDVARSYGFGHAESILGDFIRPHRDKVYVATKIGESPQNLSFVKRFLRQRFARIVRALLPKKAPRRSSAQAGSRETQFRGRRFSITEIEESVAASLKALGTDYVDILHLHSIAADSLTDEIVDRLERFRQQGSVRFLGLATSVRDTNQILKRYHQFDVVQIKDQLEDPGIEKLELSETSPSLITHSVLGRSGDLRAYLANQLSQSREIETRLARELGLESGSNVNVVDLLVRCAMARNPKGVVLCGMNRPRHIIELSKLAQMPILDSSSLEGIWTVLLELLAPDQ